MTNTASAKYTIVIPTRNRQTYCVQAVLSILAAQRNDVCIIVVDNSDDPTLLKQLLEKLDILKFVNLIESETAPLSMDNNWERAIPLLNSEWVTFIGDDDGFRLDAFEILDFLTDNIESDAYYWTTMNYKWPCFPGEEGGLINLKYIELGLNRLPGDVITQAQQNWICDDKWPISGPSVYHGLIRCSVIEKVKSDFGRYFLDHTVDYASGITNARYIDHLVGYSGAITIQGAAGPSNTANIAETKKTKTVRDQLKEWKPDVTSDPTDIVYPEFMDAHLVVPVVVGSFKSVLQKLGLGFDIPPDRFLKSCTREIMRMRDPSIFEVEKERLLKFAQKHDLETTMVEAATFRPSTRLVGAVGNEGIISFDTQQFGWTGIFDVATKCHGLTMPFKADELRHWQLIAGNAEKYGDPRSKRALERLKAA